MYGLTNFGSHSVALSKYLWAMSIFPCPACSSPNSYQAVAYFGYASTAFSKSFWASSNFFFLMASIPLS